MLGARQVMRMEPQMTWKSVTSMTLAAALAEAGLALAGEQLPTLTSGAYEVEVRLELPHLEDMAATKTATICIADSGGNGSGGLVVLSDNNPLAKCPASNVRRYGDTLSFDIVCEGGNQAMATAAYRITAENFQGRIAMKMGGKNMTMTETQRGHRIGDCAAAGAPHS